MPSDRVSLLYTSDLRPEVPRLATVLCGVLGVTMVDARRMARYGRGIALENLDPAKAGTLLPILKNMGLESICVPTASILRPPPKPVRAVLADPTGETFRYKVSFQRDYEHIPWEAIRLVSVGIVASQQFRDAMASRIAGTLPVIYRVADPEAKAELRDAIARRGIRKMDEATQAVDAPVEELPMPLLDQMKDAGKKAVAGIVGGPLVAAATDLPPGAKQREALERISEKKDLTDLQRKTREKLLKDELDTLYREQTDSFLDLITIGMSGRYRISRRDFRFDYLGARQKSTSLENFKTLVEDLLARLPDALVPPMTEKYRHMTDVRDIYFDTLDEFDRYNTWAFHMAGMGYPCASRPAVVARVAEEAKPADGHFLEPTPPSVPPGGTPAP